jgi:uncharacterized protein (TIGR04255 family)
MNNRVDKLTNPPLIEAWMEMRWKNQDPDNRFFFHAYDFAQRILPSYPIGESTNNVQIPENLSPELIRYRFRNSDDGYPLVQIGPAVASLNFGRDYTWGHFLEEAKRLRGEILACFPNSSEGVHLSLRYRNTYPFDMTQNDVRVFLREKFHIELSLPSVLQETIPAGNLLQLTYRLSDLPGMGVLQIATGVQGDELQTPVIIWELSAVSKGEDVPRFDDDLGFITWLNTAHNILETWFFGLIEGELYKTFTSNE